MLLQILKALLLTSTIGSILTIVFLICKPITKRCFGFLWQYYIWSIVLIVMMLPLTFQFPQANATVVPAISTASFDTVEAKIQSQTSSLQRMSTTSFSHVLDRIENISWDWDIASRISYVWFIGVLFVLFLHVAKYLIFLRTIEKNSVIIPSPHSEIKNMIVRKTDMIDTPLMIGLFKPTLLLPHYEMTAENLHYILLHELTHYRRHDLWYKWFAMLVGAIHWFNPFVHVISKQIDEACEISCDLSVVQHLNMQERKEYMFTILTLATNNGIKSKPLTVSMVSSYQQIKRRFIMIKNLKQATRPRSIISVILATMILGATLFTSGVVAYAINNNETGIYVYNDNVRIEFTNQPFMENGTVYLPLRETLEHFIDFSEGASKIIWNDSGEITLNLYDTASKKILDGERTVYTHLYHYKLKIGVSATYAGDKIDFILNHPPILQNEIAYAPVEFFETIKAESGLFNTFSMQHK